MGKLFNLKEWLTVADAARHLSIVFGEDVAEADVLRLALDRQLRLSVYFVNHAKARCGKVVRYNEAELMAAIASGNLPTDLKWHTWPPGAMATLRPDMPPEDAEKSTTMLMSLRIDDDRYLTLSDEITTMRGVWDLPMIGNERLDIEHEYQNLTGGPAVTLQGLDGAFVEGRDGQLCQLQEDFDDNEYQAGSSAQLEKLKQHIAENNIEATEAESLLNLHKEDRKKYLEKKKSQPKLNNYYPASSIPSDGVLVVRTDALREFEASINGLPTPTERAHLSDKLARMNQAATKFWGNADRNDRGTHPENATVTAWLVQQGFSQTLADKAATIIRPEWAPTGRKPEE
jgi:hypothetical protein